MPETVARRLVVRGRVQGVSFRDGLRREAERAGVAGWVRNSDDGSVETLLEGEADAVAAVERWCASGPPAARVEEVEAADAAPEEGGAFVVR